MSIPKTWQEVPLLVSIDFVAELFSVTKATVLNWMKSGELPSIKIGNTTRFRKQDIEAIIYKN